MFKELFTKEINQQTNEGFGISLTGVDKIFHSVLEYLSKEFNIKRVLQKGDTLKVDIENNLSSSELEEIEDEFDEFVFSIDRRKHILSIEPD